MQNLKFQNSKAILFDLTLNSVLIVFKNFYIKSILYLISYFLFIFSFY